MSKMIQLRNVPDGLHRKLKARAAMEGLSLSDYLIREMERSAQRPTLEELRKRLADLPPAVTRLTPDRLVREERERH
jgi:antitoxin FitA